MAIDFSTREGRRAQGRLIQQAAEEAGVPLEALAREIGCSRALIYQYVSGATLAQPDRLQQIAVATGKPLLFFYGGSAADDRLQLRLEALTALLEAQMQPPDPRGALSTCEQVIALASQARQPEAEVRARVRLIALLLQLGEAARALQAIEETLPLVASPAYTGARMAIEQNRGHALLALGRTGDAEASFTRCVADGGWRARWQGYVSLAAVAEQRGAYFRALQCLDEALALMSTAPDPQAAQLVRLYVAGNLANIHLACGDFTSAAAEAAQGQALALSTATRDQYTESLLTLGVCQRLQGALGASRRTLTWAAQWARLAEDAGREALAGAELAQTLADSGCFDDARAVGKDALHQATVAGARRAEFGAHLALAQAYVRAEMPQDAGYHARQAQEIGDALAHPFSQACACVLLGTIAYRRGACAEACEDWRQGCALADRLGARLPLLEARIGLARVSGTVEEARAAYGLAREIGSPLYLWPATTVLGEALSHAHADEAERYLRAALAVLAPLRDDLAQTPTGDTLLEDQRAREPYLHLARLLRLQGRAAEAEAFLEQAGWPPLLAAIGAEA